MGQYGIQIESLLLMYDLKFFAKRKNQIDFLVQTVYIFSENSGKQFEIKKYRVLIMERRKVIRTNGGIILPDGQNMKDIDEAGCTHLGILEIGKIKQKEMKETFSKEYLRRLRLILRSKLTRRNKVMAVNTWVVSMMRYRAGILKWNKDELKSLDRKTRSFMTIHGALHPKSDFDRVYLRGEMGGRGLIGCEGCRRMEENSLVQPLIGSVNGAETIEQNEKTNKEFKPSWMKEKKELWKKKRMKKKHGTG